MRATKWYRVTLTVATVVMVLILVYRHWGAQSEPVKATRPTVNTPEWQAKTGDVVTLYSARMFPFDREWVSSNEKHDAAWDVHMIERGRLVLPKDGDMGLVFETAPDSCQVGMLTGPEAGAKGWVSRREMRER